MDVVIAPAEKLAKIAADEIAALLRKKPNAVLGVATGSSPLGVYSELAKQHEEDGLSFAQATAFMLDEYVGIASDHPERYRNVVDREIVSRFDWPADQVHGPDGQAEDLDAACAAYEQAIIDAGGVDIQLLGLGTNGHIAFNEPGSPYNSRTRKVPLTHQTRVDNARFFDGDIHQVPELCLTQGLGTVMDAQRLILIATGEGKAEAVRQMIEGDVTPDWPATVIKSHPNALVLIDETAASQLTGPAYFVDLDYLPAGLKCCQFTFGQK